MEDPPPKISARVRRNRTKPEECLECWMRFSYLGERDKHIRSRHPHIASAYSISMERHACQWCHKTYMRKDYLTRHLTRKHGREKTRRGRKRQQQGGGVGELT
ncbi:hypothetical protein C8A05DRAFT_14512 [Staphylotrichum tortipilum]|uniref:C2H2-type domain-containing protein n=1 Tax=Staphylotrichum tortipilum TaxID=2831512 RepID=A0AAN6RUI1_9PEZI|nr:hypothetical protein C8A05DRAFT_14512 [Staphylotrichum longicolle]